MIVIHIYTQIYFTSINIAHKTRTNTRTKFSVVLKLNTGDIMIPLEASKVKYFQ